MKTVLRIVYLLIVVSDVDGRYAQDVHKGRVIATASQNVHPTI